jgi:S1-C subfamily serine protease
MGTNTPIPPREARVRLKFAQFIKACEPAFRLARKYARELIIAFVLAVLAAVLYEPVKDFLAKRALQSASKAVAELIIRDAEGKYIGKASGVFISPDGLLVTNAHVATAAKGGDIVAQLSTHAFYEVKKIVGVNPAYDIAVLQFQASEVPFVRINTAIIAQAGDRVWAIGSPKGLEGSISEGVISRPQRQIKGVDFIQFTAPISRGSSGGGLFNLNGRMLGITTAAIIDEGAQNLNFAVPIKYIDRASEGTTEFTKDSPDFYYAQGTIYANKKDYDRAEENFKNAIRMDHNYVNAYASLGDLYYDTERYDEEVKMLENARLILPDDPDINTALGAAYEDVARFDEAIAAFKRVLKSRPDDKDALYWVCVLDLVTAQDNDASNYLPKLKKVNAGTGKEIEMLLNRTANPLP